MDLKKNSSRYIVSVFLGSIFFASLSYAHQCQEYFNKAPSSLEHLESKGQFKTTRGQWVVYRQNSDPKLLVQDLAEHHTGWLIAKESLALFLIERGDVYIYYSLNEKGQATIPRLALHTYGNMITEILGVSKDQKLDSQIKRSAVLKNKIKEFGVEGERYLKRELNHRKITEIETKSRKGVRLSYEDLKTLYETEDTLGMIGFRKDPRIQQIISTRDIKADLVRAFDYQITEKDITITQEEFLDRAWAGRPSKVHYGDLIFQENMKGPLVFPEILLGDLHLNSHESVEGIVLPKKLREMSTSSLKKIRGVVFPEEAIRLDLDSVESLESSTFPRKVERIHLSSLKTAWDIVFPEEMGLLDLSSLKSLRGVTLPKKLISLTLRNLKDARGVIFPEEIEGILDLNFLESLNGAILPKKVRDMHLLFLKEARGVVFPEEVEALYLSSLEHLDGAILPKEIKHLNLTSLRDARGVVFPKEMLRLNLRSLESLEGVTLPQSGEVILNEALQYQKNLVPEGVQVLWL